MARKPIEIPIASETKAFGQGIESGVIRPLEDAEDALKALAKVDAGDDIERDLKQAQKATESLKDETKKTAREIEEEFKKSYRKTRDDSDDTTRKMKDGFREAADEAQQSGREAAASFSGGFEDVADFVQETLANALSGFGPIGLAAGVALASVIGSVLANAEMAQDKLNAARERASELASTLYENGGEIPMAERLQEMFDLLAEESGSGNGILNLIDQWTDFGSTLDAIRRTAKLTGSGVSDMIDALSGGDLDKSQRMLDAINRQIEELESNVSTAWAWNPDLQALREARDEIDKTVQAERLAADINDELGAQRVAAAEETAEKVKAAGESVVSESLAGYDRMRDAAYTKATADNAAFDIDKWLSYVEEARGAADAYRSNLQSMQLTPSEWENLLALPDDARTSIVNSYATSGEEGKARIRAALGDGGAGDAGAEAAVAFDSSFDPKAKVEANVDTKRAEASVKELTKDREIKVKVKLDTSEYDNWDPARKTGRVNVTVDKAPWNDWRPAQKNGKVYWE